MILLNLIILVPFLAMAAIAARLPARLVSFSAALINLALSLILAFRFVPGGPRFQFVGALSLLPDHDLKYMIGVDGLSIVMILLTTLVTVAAVWVAPPDVKLPGRFYSCLLLISAGALGAFASLDLFFFYAFHELALIPTFILIGVWGHGDRQSAAWKITIYLATGSFILLIGLIGLYQSVPEALRTFDIPKLQALAQSGAIPAAGTYWIYLCLLVGFGILISLFPFHTWAPPAYASAPTSATMLHAGVLKKFGLYGLLRVALPILPDAARHWANLLIILLVGNIIYVGLVTIVQRRLDMMLAYSSVMHMGYIFLGIAAFNTLALSGAALLMFAHGLSIAALFALAGEVRRRTGSLAFSHLGGIARSLPLLGFCFGLAAFASIGLPGFANFAAETLVFFGAFKNSGTLLQFSGFQWATVAGLWGVVISAVYMLRGYRNAFMGEAISELSGEASLSFKWPVIMLLTVLLTVGFFPSLLLHLLTPGLRAFSL